MGRGGDDEVVEWTLALREVFQDAQIEAIEEAQYHTTKQPAGARGASGGAAAAATASSGGGDGAKSDAAEKAQEEEARARDERALRPAVRRLRQIYRSEVGDGESLAEEQFALFLEEMWIAMARVLVAPRLHAVTVGTIASLVGMFLRSTQQDDAQKHAPAAPAAAASAAAADRGGDDEEEATDAEKAEDAALNELRAELLKRLIEATKAEDKTARLRACQMLQFALNTIDYIDEETFKRLRKAMIPRASDKLATVRLQTALVLKRLQDIDKPTDEVTAELVRLMVSDPSKDVRKVAVQNVAVTKVTYRDLVIRIRDVSEEVRAAVFNVFRDQVQFKDIPINDRAQLLDQGLQDRSPAVRSACEHMLVDRWLPDNNYSPSRLVRALDVEHFAPLCTKVSKLLIKYQRTHLPFEPVLPCISVPDVMSQRDSDGAFEGDIKDALDGASVFFWREQCVYFQDDEKDEEKLSAVLPSINDYIAILALAGMSGEEEMMFVMQQLLALGRSLDFQDEFGRGKLLTALRKLLGDTSLDARLTPGLMELMANIYAVGNSQHDFVRVVAEIISDLYDPMDSERQDQDQEPQGLTEEELEVASKRFDELDKLIETLEYESEEYVAVQREMEELEKKLQDPKVLAWLRCLEILSQLLKLTNYNLKHPVIAGVGRYILPSIESDIPAIRETGMECLGLFCLLDRRVAERHLVVFWRALNNPDEEREVKMNCIRAIMDMVFSFANLVPEIIVQAEVKSEPTEEEDGDEAGEPEAASLTTEKLELKTVFMGLAQLAATSHEDLDVQATIVEGFAKLFLMHRVRYPPVLSFLLETFFSPRLQKVQLLSEHGYQARALQLMSVFFPTFVKASTTNCTLFEEASIYLLQKSIEQYEPSDDARDALNQIDLSTCAKYIFHLLSHSEDTADIVLKKSETEESGASTNSSSSSSAIPQRCAHHNRVAINMCVDILALEKLREIAPKIDSAEFDSRQKLLAKLLVLTDISAAETRSALLLLSLLRDVTATCFKSQRVVLKSLEALSKRLAASHALGRRQLGKTTAQGTVMEQDQVWASERLEERAEALRVAIKECTTSRKKIRRASANASKRRASKRDAESDSSSQFDSENESSDDGSGDDMKDEEESKVERVAPQRRSSRQSTSQAVTRMREKAREFDVAMKIAFEESEEEEEDSEEDADGDDDGGEEDGEGDDGDGEGEGEGDEEKEDVDE